MITPWSTNAVEITQNMGINGILRIEEYVEVCAQKKPMLFATPVVKENGVSATFESIRLPLSDDGGSVSKIFSALNHNVLALHHYKIFDTDPEGSRF